MSLTIIQRYNVYLICKNSQSQKQRRKKVICQLSLVKKNCVNYNMQQWTENFKVQISPLTIDLSTTKEAIGFLNQFCQFL